MSFTDNNDGTVSDRDTGLMWQQDGAPNRMTWKQALVYCEGLNLGGYTDWRSPTIKELRSLVDYSRYNPAINTAYFPNTISSWYWSSTTNEDYTHYAWSVNFSYGYDASPNNDYDNDVRAVRGGQPGSIASSAEKNVAAYGKEFNDSLHTLTVDELIESHRHLRAWNIERLSIERKVREDIELKAYKDAYDHAMKNQYLSREQILAMTIYEFSDFISGFQKAGCGG